MDEFFEYFQFYENNENQYHGEEGKHDRLRYSCVNRTRQREKGEKNANMIGIPDFHKSRENRELFRFDEQHDLLDGGNGER